jgi:hypothetical protein
VRRILARMVSSGRRVLLVLMVLVAVVVVLREKADEEAHAETLDGI